MIPYGRQTIEDDDIQAVTEVLSSDWLTTGPAVAAFEAEFARQVGAAHAVAVANGTAALHCAMHALGVGPGDEVIVPPMTFAATANAVLYQGGMPVFADVEPNTLLLDPAAVEAAITSRTKAILTVDFAGHPSHYNELRRLADRHGLALVADACHALGAALDARPVGSLADITVFSFHPVKHITTGEGGMLTTADTELSRRFRRFRGHGISADFHEREARGSWEYDMVELGFNYRISDIQCALGSSQLRKLPRFLARRRELARAYDQALDELPGLSPLAVIPGASHAYHLYVVRVRGGARNDLFAHLRQAGIAANVHYKPVHLHSYYQEHLGTRQGMFPGAETAYQEILSLPLFPGLGDAQLNSIISALVTFNLATRSE